MPMTTLTKPEILAQFHSLQHTGFDTRLEQRAAGHGLPAALLYAIASRETNCLNTLGDFQAGEAHGIGILQIDIQNPIARQARDSGSWKTDPDPLLEFGARLLQDNLASLKREHPLFSGRQLLKVAASAYNCGPKNALTGLKNGDSDHLTTGHNYGRDVMTRMAIFEEILEERLIPPA